MPIKIPDKLPATAQLRKENIFVMSEKKAMHQDIRPLKIVIVNLMPTKIAPETQLLRLLSNSPLQIEIDFLQMDTHESKNTPSEHLATFYTTFDEIKDSKYDGMIITGAPVENLEYEDVDYDISGYEIYNKYSNQIGEYKIVKLEINEYDDGSEKHNIIDLK